MTKIFFVGDLRSPFIEQDLEMLQEDNTVNTFDLGKHAFSFRQILNYQILCLQQSLKIHNADLIWIWFADYPALSIILIAKLFRKPIVVNVGGWEVCKSPEINYGNQLSTIRGAVTRWILRNVDRCIVPSQAYRAIIHKLERDAYVCCFPNWIDTKLCDIATPRKYDRVVTAFCADSTRILKGIPTFEAVSKQVPYEMKAIKNISHESLIDEFKHAKVYCQLSYTESFGMSLLEAMACGCVPVVTDRDALPEVVGGCGYIVPYGDVEKTKEAIEKAMKVNGTKARDRARLFGRDKKKAQVNALIRKLVVPNIASSVPSEPVIV